MTNADRDAAADLIAFVDAAPSPFHAVAEMARRAEAAGFERLDERHAWALAPGDRRYVVRDGGSIAAFVVGQTDPVEAGFRLIGAHTDSPTFKVRPRADVRRSGYRQVGVEPYGSVLAHTWLDRDLTLAGRIALREPDGGIGLRLVHLPGAWLRIPSLAIHLSRELRTEGLQLDPQRHLVPVWGPDTGHADGDRGLLHAVAEQAGVPAERLLAADLVTADTQPAALGGADDAYVLAPRLDNLGSCHAGLAALVAAEAAPATQLVVANDHEEVGSGSAEGARGPFLSEVVSRIVAATHGPDPQGVPRASARS